MIRHLAIVGCTLALLAAALDAAPEIDAVGRRVSVPLHGGTDALFLLAHAVDQIGLDPADVSLRRPDLDEVFLHLTAIPVPGPTRRPSPQGAGR